MLGAMRSVLEREEVVRQERLRQVPALIASVSSGPTGAVEHLSNASSARSVNTVHNSVIFGGHRCWLVRISHRLCVGCSGFTGAVAGGAPHYQK